MARDHARIQVAIWRNRGFRALTRDAQYLYLTVVSQPGLSYCGVLDWRPSRIAALSADGDEAAIVSALSELVERRFIHVDESTEELAVRTYMKHDGVLNRVNMGKAAGRALDVVVSLVIRDEILGELARFYRKQPELAGWAGLFDELSVDDVEAVRGGVLVS